jgi:hypothetical protein
MLDLDSELTSLFQNKHKNKQTMNYNKAWEDEIIYKIACRLSKFPVDIE